MCVTHNQKHCANIINSVKDYATIFSFVLARKETIIIARGDSLFYYTAREQLLFSYRSFVSIHESRILYECISIVKIIPLYEFRLLHEFISFHDYYTILYNRMILIHYANLLYGMSLIYNIIVLSYNCVTTRIYFITRFCFTLPPRSTSTHEITRFTNDHTGNIIIITQINMYQYRTCKYSIKRALLDDKVTRCTILSPGMTRSIDATAHRAAESPETRNSYRNAKTRRSPGTMINMYGLHVLIKEHPDNTSIRAKDNVTSDIVKSDVIAKTPAGEMTPLAEGVAAGASWRLAGRPMVERPLEAEAIRGGVATTRELSARRTLYP